MQGPVPPVETWSDPIPSMLTEATIASDTQPYMIMIYQGFYKSGYPQIAGWFKKGESQSNMNDDWEGTPMTQETSMYHIEITMKKSHIRHYSM